MASASENSENTQELSGSASSLSPWQEKHQDKRYVGGYAGVGGYGTGLDTLGAAGAGYYNPYQAKLGLGKLALRLQLKRILEYTKKKKQKI